MSRHNVTNEHRVIRDRSKLAEFIRHRYGVEADIAPHVPKQKDGRDIMSGCLDYGSSEGPLMWINNRIAENGGFKCGYPPEADEFEPFLVEANHLHLAHFARSKIFRTTLLPEPIDLNAAKVSVNTYSDSFQPWQKLVRLDSF